MRAEDLKEWLNEAKREKDPVDRRWELVVRLVQVLFRDGTLPVDIVWEKMVLIPKGKGEYRGIGLVEVLWKVCAVVVNCWLNRSVVIQDALHRFRSGRETWTTTL